MRLNIYKNSNKQKIAALIIIRLNSSRLKNKALRKINLLSSVQILIKRLKKSKNISQIIIATSPHKNLFKLRKISNKEKIGFFVGSENDVLKRIIQCAEKFKLKSIIRITGDDIFRDFEKLDEAILSHKKSKKDITVMQNIPYGLGSEIFNTNVLKFIYRKMNQKCDSGYLSWFIDRKIFKVNDFDCKYKKYKDIILSLDYKIDLDIMKFITKQIGIFFSTNELIDLYLKYKKKFRKFKLLRDKIDKKVSVSHHPKRKVYNLTI